MSTHENELQAVTGAAAWTVRRLRSPWVRLSLFIVVLATVGWVGATWGTAGVGLAKEWVSGLGPLGPVAFVILYAVATIALFPAALLSVAAGVLFGAALGTLVVWAGAMLGATAAFLLGRALSPGAIEQLTGGRLDRLDAYLARRGTLAVLYLRLVPLFPFGLVNYGAAVTAVTLRQYLIGSALGMLPGVVIYVLLGGAATRPESMPFLVSVMALLALAIAGGLAARRSRWRVGAATNSEGV